MYIILQLNSWWFLESCSLWFDVYAIYYYAEYIIDARWVEFSIKKILHWVDVIGFKWNIVVLAVASSRFKTKLLQLQWEPSSWIHFARLVYFLHFAWKLKSCATSANCLFVTNPLQHVHSFSWTMLRARFPPSTKKWRVTFSHNLFSTVKNYLAWNVVALAENGSLTFTRTTIDNKVSSLQGKHWFLDDSAESLKQ